MRLSTKSNTLQVANKKQRDTAAADAEMKAKREAQAKKDGTDASQNRDEAGGGDVLGAEDDEDVIF